MFTPKNTRKYENNRNRLMPKLRTNKIVVQNVEDEILVYDLKTDKAHNLNRTTSIIWKKCNGVASFAEVLELLEQETGAELDLEIIRFALKELSDNNLLDEGAIHFENPVISRRQMIGRYVLPALALPLIMSLVAPTSAQMASCLGTGQMGCNTTPCCPNNTCQAVVGSGGIIQNTCVATP